MQSGSLLAARKLKATRYKAEMGEDNALDTIDLDNT
jgi:hypothetical protein